MTTIDLNADLGEGMGTDEQLMEIVSSASIACGGHAGDAESMSAVLRMAKAKDVAAGAHPSFADWENFGRKRLNVSEAELKLQIEMQLSTIMDIAAEVGVPLKYVKLHGALANMASEDQNLAGAVFLVVRVLNSSLAVVAIANSEQVRAAENLGLRVIREAYADRAYQPNGLLVPRSEPGAVLTDPGKVVAQCMRLAEKGEIVAADGSVIKSDATSICLHGDTPGAVELAKSVRTALEGAGIEIRAPY